MSKVDELDLKGNSVSTEDGQSENTELKESKPEEESIEPKEESKEEVEESEDVDNLKDRLEKTEKDRDNYKKGMLKYKNLSLKKEEPEEEKEEEEYPEWDDSSKKFQEQTLNQASKKAEESAKSFIERSNEKAAIAQFIKQHPELSEEKTWNEIVANYSSRSGKDTPDDVLNDLEEALVVTKYRRGEFKPKTDSEVAEMSTVSKTTSKTVKDKEGSLSQGAISLAERLRVDPKKLAEEDDTSFAEINL